MVYSGPSKGCRRCRTRRIKCDQRRPACVKCTAKGISCPGYSDVFEKAHRDETAKTVKRHAQRSNATLTPRSSLATNRISSWLSVIPPSISQDAESTALSFFFLRYSLSHDSEASCSFLGILPEMFSRSDASSPLCKAATALALQVVHLHNLCSGASVLEHTMYGEAVARSQEAIASPAQSKSDELLMTTLVLDAYERNRAVFMRDNRESHARTHIAGCIALLQHRGSLNYRDELSWRLVIASRNRLLQRNRNNSAEICGLDTINTVWDGGVNARPGSAAIEADTLAFQLSQLQQLLRTNQEVPTCQSTTAINLAIKCDIWRNTLPPTWKPTSVSACTHASSIPTAAVYEHVSPAVYTSLSIANSLNSQRMTELGVLELICDCSIAVAAKRGQDQPQTHRTVPPMFLGRAQILIDEVCASVPFMTMEAKAIISMDSAPNASCVFPWGTTEHRQQVAASGFYMMHNTLEKVLEIVGDCSGLRGEGMAVREGQVDWMRGQSHRLREVLHLQ
ncbi:hypothetical protein B0J13DRAFT_453281 [Dactylonectria estremocensis]|uniref:Zn(2)-C6 fungal-type domain-containing protein n=1 Tax=Dactylonectria estremocensis TaxID=1079267 RepID=A0A9P9DZI5_9HYPO|nr:hypothetical protein B0J13DRAFT_453281 [Dactylonectria estremocensis]